MKHSTGQILLYFLTGLVAGYFAAKFIGRREAFTSGGSTPTCGACGSSITQCGCGATRPICPPCPPQKEPDMSRYVLKSSVPPCPACPDLRNYMLKTECPPVPDLSNYVLKSSIPKNGPVILDCSKCKKPKGECPPCPRPRCPEVQCPEAPKCPPCPSCPRPSCPQTKVKCQASEVDSGNRVRPYLAPLSMPGFGQS